MPEVVNDVKLVAHCGLYCGACGAYRRGRCKGCAENAKATWCKVRTCCMEHHYATCADCSSFVNPRECAKYHNLIARVVGFVLRSDRARCIARIREVGTEAFAAEMAEKDAHTLRP